MLILIDYDNVDRLERRRGLRNVAEVVLGKLPTADLPDGAGTAVRLYGGWYEGRRLSREAQRLSAEIGRDFPGVVSLPGPHAPRRVRVAMELARSLSIDPSRDLFNTYRTRSAPKVHAKRFPFAGCTKTSACPLAAVHTLLRADACPEQGCGVAVADVMERAEQKLVDTMLTADLIHAAHSAPNEIVVVTTDDDLWPGIRTAVHHGATVHHVHPKHGRSTPPFYAAAVTANYHQYSF